MVSYLDIDDDLLFPDSDGQPMADNTEQYEWIVKIKENLEIIFADDPNIFIAGDLLWYPVRSTLVSPVAPDVMVAFGCPKGRRGSYCQWNEENIAPQVVFEILSPKNTKAEMSRKLEFYDTYGVEEYYLYNPMRCRLQGWQRQGESLVEIISINDWISPRLGMRFIWDESSLELYRPDGERFLTTVELDHQMRQEKKRADREKKRADREKKRADRLAERLQMLGLSLEEE